MHKKIKHIYFLLFLFIFLNTYNMVRAQNVETLRGTEITSISGRKYYPAVKRILDAWKEIQINNFYSLLSSQGI
jgi:hypothetical protein